MKFAIKLAVLSCSTLTALPVLAAGELQGQLGVQIVIGSGCTVTNGSNDGTDNNFGSISFGEYFDLNNIVDANSVGSGGGGSFGLQCSAGTDYTIALNQGQNFGAGSRRMVSSGQFVTYGLYQDAGRTTAWGDGTGLGGVLSSTGTGSDEEIVVYGRVPNQGIPPSGTYLDTVQVTVTW